jgi:hypothetical protein
MSYTSLVFSLLLLTACDGESLTASSAPDRAAERVQGNEHSGTMMMHSADDGVFLCQGTLTVVLRSGLLSGGGDCGDLDLTVEGVLTDEGVVYGTISQSDPLLPSTGALHGQKGEDGIAIIWSLDIPLPDDLPLDEIYQLSADGDAWLSR